MDDTIRQSHRSKLARPPLHHNCLNQTELFDKNLARGPKYHVVLTFCVVPVTKWPRIKLYKLCKLYKNHPTKINTIQIFKNSPWGTVTKASIVEIFHAAGCASRESPSPIPFLFESDFLHRRRKICINL